MRFQFLSFKITLYLTLIITPTQKMKAQDLIKMTWYKNADNKYHCPVRFREFTDNSHIVCNMVTGNVYSMEAITELCYKNKNMKDLINDKPFKRSDIVTVQGEL